MARRAKPALRTDMADRERALRQGRGAVFLVAPGRRRRALRSGHHASCRPGESLRIAGTGRPLFRYRSRGSPATNQEVRSHEHVAAL